MVLNRRLTNIDPLDIMDDSIINYNIKPNEDIDYRKLPIIKRAIINYAIYHEYPSTDFVATDDIIKSSAGVKKWADYLQ